MKTLVTGGGGFLGRSIVEQLLARGDTVTVFARGAYPELTHAGACVVRGDLLDKQAIHAACQGMEIVFHAAAQAGIWGTWESFYQPNVVGTRHVIAACLAQGVPKLIFSSSPSVVFDNRPHVNSDESLPYPDHYENFYSHTKALAEQEVMTANSPDLLTVALRPHLIWGPRDPHLLPRLIARARAGQLMQVGNGDNLVDLTYVEDAARAHLLAGDALQPGSPIAGAIYFINQDEPVKLWPWINNLLKELAIPPITRRISLPVARTLGAVMETAYRLLQLPGEPRLTRFLASELALSHYYDISKAKRDFHYQPQLSIDAALEKTLPFLRRL